MRGERVDARVPVWVDGSRATIASRTLIGLRGPAGDQRLLVEVDAGGAVRLLDVDLARAAARETRVRRAPDAMRTSQVRRAVGRGIAFLLIGVAAASLAALGLGFARASVIQSGSMEPTFRAGDLWLGISSELREPAIGDVVLFTARRMDGTPVAPFTHRIVAGNAADGFHTRGDANDAEDPFVVARSDISDVMVATVPFGGIIVTLRPVLIALLAIGLGFMLRGRGD